MDPKFLAGKGDNPWTVLALFGDFISGRTAGELFKVARKVVERAGLSVNVLGVHTSETYGKYKRCSPQLLRSMQRHDLVGFSAAYVPSAETDAAKLGWILAGASGVDFVICGRTDRLFPEVTTIVPIIREVADVYPIRYGYHYVIDKYYGPDIHAVGMMVYHAFRRDLPDLPPVEKKRTSRWFNTCKTALQVGALRDVFPLNLLTEVHRGCVIDGVPLFEWIRQDALRGRLEGISPGLFAWHVPNDGCEELGDIIEAAGLLA